MTSLQAATTTKTPLIVIVTGYSGAGKSSVLRTLEDQGFFCIDNLPLALLASFTNLIENTLTPKKMIALGIDIRAGTNMQDLLQEITVWKTVKHFMVKVIFVTASPLVLIKRFQETRRKHPLNDHSGDLVAAVHQEITILQPLYDTADLVLDTDQFTIHQLRSVVRNFFTDEKNRTLVVTLMSFGFKHGIPHESNFVFDARTLPNPHFIPELKHLNGRDKEISTYLFDLPEVQEYWQNLIQFFSYAIQKSHQENRLSMHIALGCTGGKHRSVALVEKLAQFPLNYVQFFIRHRDIHKE